MPQDLKLEPKSSHKSSYDIPNDLIGSLREKPKKTEIEPYKEPSKEPSTWDALNTPIGPFNRPDITESTRSKISEYGSHLPENVGPIPIRAPITGAASALSTIGSAPMEMGRRMMSPIGLATSALPEAKGIPYFEKLAKMLGLGASVGFGAQGAKQALEPIGEKEQPMDYLSRVLSGSGQTLFGGAGVAGSVRDISKPKFSQSEAHDTFVSGLKNRGQDFDVLHKDLTNSGHLTEIAKTTDITKQTLPEMSKTLRTYINNWWDNYISPATQRHIPGTDTYDGTTEGINGNHIIDMVGRLKDTGLDEFRPGRAETIDKEISIYKDKEIPLEAAEKLLTSLNAEIDSLENMSSEDKASRMRIQPTKEALNATVHALRGEFLNTLNQLGEKGIEEARKDHGNLSQFKGIIDSNIEHAESARVGQPRQRDVPYRTLSRHKILGPVALGELASNVGGGRHLGEAVLPVLAGFESVDVARERAATPTRRIQKAFKMHANDVGEVKRPYQEQVPPKPIITPLKGLPPVDIAPPEPFRMPPEINMQEGLGPVPSPENVSGPEVTYPEKEVKPLVDDKTLRTLYEFSKGADKEKFRQQMINRGLLKEEVKEEVRPINQTQVLSRLLSPQQKVEAINKLEKTPGGVKEQQRILEDATKDIKHNILPNVEPFKNKFEEVHHIEPLEKKPEVKKEPTPKQYGISKFDYTRLRKLGYEYDDVQKLSYDERERIMRKRIRKKPEEVHPGFGAGFKEGKLPDIKPIEEELLIRLPRLHNEKAQELFGKRFSALNDKQQDFVMKKVERDHPELNP